MGVTTILDGCCCAGLGADGYASVGIQPTGWDIEPQTLYPYPFHQGDILDVLGGPTPEAYDAIHTSPVCQIDTRLKHLRTAQKGTPRYASDLLTPVIDLLRTRWAHKPWIVENVEDSATRAKMAPREGETLLRLCGSSFGLQVQRHRLFLVNFPVRQPPCDHSTFELDPITRKPRPWGVWHVPADQVPSGGRTARDAEHGREVMGSRRLLPWDLLKQGFPPAYTAHIGADLLLHISDQKPWTPSRTAAWADAKRREGWSWSRIGDELGVTRQAAHQRFR